MFLSWVLSYQDLHMTVLPGLIISILFHCRINYSILAHFSWSIYTIRSLTQYLFFNASSIYISLLPIYTVFSHEVVLLDHIYTGILQYCGCVILIYSVFNTVVVRYSKVAHIRGFFSSFLRFLCPQCIGSF